MVYDGETLTMWWPAERFAIRIRGSTLTTPKQIWQVLKENTLFSAVPVSPIQTVGNTLTKEALALNFRSNVP